MGTPRNTDKVDDEGKFIRIECPVCHVGMEILENLFKGGWCGKYHKEAVAMVIVSGKRNRKR